MNNKQDMLGQDFTECEIRLFNAALDKYALTEFAPLIRPHLMRSINIGYGEPDDSAEIGNSRFGGWPDMLPAWEWPKDPAGKYLLFLMQINLSDIENFHNILPKRGLLLFFLGGHFFDPYGKVIFYDEPIEQLKNRQLPGKLELDDFSIGFTNLDAFESVEEDLLFAFPHQLSFSTSLTLPSLQSRVMTDHDGNKLDDSLDYKRARQYIDMQYEELNDDPNETFHNLLGHTGIQGIDPRDMGIPNQIGPPKGVYLLNVRDDDRTILSALHGTISYIISHEDLVVKNFSNIYMNQILF